MVFAGNVITVSTARGGAGKSSLATGLAVLSAMLGYRVLFIDMDPSAGASFDLGLRNGPKDDDGQSLFDSLAHLQPLTPVVAVRPDLDVVVGGTMSAALSGLAGVWDKKIESRYLALAHCLEPIRSRYDLVVVDTAPGEESLNQMNALAAAGYVLIPTRTDRASLDGIGGVSMAFRKLRGVASPQLLAVALFGVNPSAKRILREVSKELKDKLPEGTKVCNTPIRYAEKAATESRALGLTAVEYARDVVDGAPKFWEEGGRDANVAHSATKVAGDYLALTSEILSQWQTMEADRKLEGQSFAAAGGER